MMQSCGTRRRWRRVLWMLAVCAIVCAGTAQAAKQPDRVPVPREAGGEANLILPDLGQVNLLGVNARSLLMGGIGVCALGLVFGLLNFTRLKRLPVHTSMLEVSELIYETCKTYLITQIRFIGILWIFIGAIIVAYFKFLATDAAGAHMDWGTVAIILLFSLVGIAGSVGVAWFGIRVNTFANSRMAFASLRAKPYPLHAIPLEAGMSIGMLLISVELFIMLCILLFIPGTYAGPCFIGFAIGESLGAAALRIAGGIFTKIADIGSDLMKIVFNIKEDDARNPGVIADCVGDNAGDSVGPSADGFETYGVTGVALITFILLAVHGEAVQVQLLVWIFVMRIMMIIASGLSYFVAGNFSAYWLGLSIAALMGTAYYVAIWGPSLGTLMTAAPVFAFGLVAFGFLGMGPVTIAVDSYGPVTDNAQSVFELSVVETIPGIKESLKRDYGFDVRFDRAKDLLEENDGAGNTFKATAKPVLIGTAVVGSTTMTFSIIMSLTADLTRNVDRLSIIYPPFLLGLITGGAVIYWFTGAATQAVSTGAYRAVEFIKANIRLEGVEKASVSDSKKVVEICTQYAQRGMFNIFLTVFFSTLAFSFLQPFFFIGYLISIALFGLFQAIFM